MPRNNGDIGLPLDGRQEIRIPRNRRVRVLIIQGEMKQYRLPFFTKLARKLSHDGVSLRVAYSDPNRADNRNDNRDLPVGVGLKVNGYRLPWSQLLYQPLLQEVVSSDFVIAEHGNRYLLNYLLILLSILGLKRIALWGMGENRGKDRSEYSEWVRRRLVKWVDWCFSYTEGTKKYYEDCGLPEGRITVAQNAVDTDEFSEMMDSISQPELRSARQKLGIEENDPVALYCGVLNRDKGVSFLLEAVREVRLKLPRFHLIIAGGGPEAESVMAAAAADRWIHHVGPQFGREKAILFKLSGVFLLPGYVGLAILDAFAAGLPLVTTNIPYHRPEIEYLESGVNGLMTEADVGAYASQIVLLLSNDAMRHRLSEGARDSGRKYSIDAMVSNFSIGIRLCLSLGGGHFRSVPRAAE
jgi:glycosyltransferase involved in cell wall biosynthesis